MMKKTKLVMGIATALTMAGMLAAPQAQAHSKAKKHSHHSTPSYSHSTSTYTSTTSVSNTNSRVEALEAQLQAMQYELQSLRAQAGRSAPAESAKVQELEQWMNSVKAEPSKSSSKDNMVFFRGGYGHADSKRGGTLDPTAAGGNSGGVLNGAIGGQDSWYFGAGFDWSLNDDLFGMMNGTEVLAELMFDYKELGERAPNGVTPAIGAATGLPGVNTQTATVNQLTLAASPKVKFFKGQAFRPWLVPVGFELSVVSPPSDAITVLNPGFQFGLGADYKIWNNLYVGADARYHYAPDNVDGVNTNGVTAGGYVGIGF